MLRNLKQNQNDFWDNAANNKEFKDPFYLDNFKKYVDMNAPIIEYGCGYGRLINLLDQNGYHKITGFDFSKGMIERGTKQFPHLDLQHISHASLPLYSERVDAAIVSTVLCCVPDSQLQIEIINELERVLKPNGILYLTDFLITENDEMKNKYEKDLNKYDTWGIYETSEGALVRHHDKSHIEKILSSFTTLWYIEEDFVTMNNNIVKTFHGIYRKMSS